MAKFQVRFDADLCKGCRLCIMFCPKKIIETSTRINNKGYSPAGVKEQEKCVGCRACTLVCPDGVIEIYKEDAIK